MMWLDCHQCQKFHDHVVHAVDKRWQDELKLKEMDKNVQRKLAQLQSRELQGKNKSKTQAPVIKGAEEQLKPPAPTTETQPLNTLPPQAPVHPSLVVNGFQQTLSSQYYDTDSQQQHRSQGGYKRGAFCHLQHIWNMVNQVILLTVQECETTPILGTTVAGPCNMVPWCQRPNESLGSTRIWILGVPRESYGSVSSQ